jgi:hypothetical protein
MDRIEQAALNPTLVPSPNVAAHDTAHEVYWTRYVIVNKDTEHMTEEEFKRWWRTPHGMVLGLITRRTGWIQA